MMKKGLKKVGKGVIKLLYLSFIAFSKCKTTAYIFKTLKKRRINSLIRNLFDSKGKRSFFVL